MTIVALQQDEYEYLAQVHRDKLPDFSKAAAGVAIGRGLDLEFINWKPQLWTVVYPFSQEYFLSLDGEQP